MDGDELRKKGAELTSLREEASRIVAQGSSEGRALTIEEDASVLALMRDVSNAHDWKHARARHSGVGTLLRSMDLICLESMLVTSALQAQQVMNVHLYARVQNL